MATKRLHNNPAESLFFCTFTCYRWLSLIEITNGYEFVYRWFAYLNQKRQADIVAFVIMPNHIHVIILVHDACSINKIIAEGKRFMAYSIVKRLNEHRRDDILDFLHGSVSEKRKNKGQRFRVFEDSFDAKIIISYNFLMQKLNYIHLNPVRGKWRLANDYTLYTHSSASFYENGIIHHYKPVHFEDINMSRGSEGLGGESSGESVVGVPKR